MRAQPLAVMAARWSSRRPCINALSITPATTRSFSIACPLPVNLEDSPYILTPKYPSTFYKDFDVSLEKRPAWSAERFRSRLEIDLRRLDLPKRQEDVLVQLVGPRYNRKRRKIAFVSRGLTTANANDNRVFDLFDVTLVKSLEIARQFRDEDREQGAEIPPVYAKSDDRLDNPIETHASESRMELLLTSIQTEEDYQRSLDLTPEEEAEYKERQRRGL